MSGKKLNNIYDIGRRSLDDALANASQRQREDLNGGTYAERKKEKLIKLLEQEDFRDGRLLVKISGGNKMLGKANELFLGKEGKEHEERMLKDDVLIHKGNNDVVFSLMLTDRYKMEKKDGTIENVTKDMVKQYAPEYYKKVEERKEEAYKAMEKEAVEKGFIKQPMTEKQMKDIVDDAYQHGVYMTVDEIKSEIRAKNIKVMKQKLRTGELKAVYPNVAGIGKGTTKKDIGLTFSPIYNLKIEINGIDVTEEAAKKTPHEVELDKEGAINDALKQIGRVGDFAPTKLEKAGAFLWDQGVRGAAFRASSSVTRGASAVLTGHQKEVNQAEQMISSALSRALAILGQQTRTR